MIYVYNPLTGEIVNRIQGKDSFAEHYGRSWITSDELVDDSTHYICLQTKELAAFPPKPSPFSRWDWLSMGWKLDDVLIRNAIIADRAKLLAASDWTQLPDVPLATKEAWATYRQALRDITAQPGFPMNIEWPVAP